MKTIFLLIFCVLNIGWLRAEEGKKLDEPPSSLQSDKELFFETAHEVKIKGKLLSYQALAGNLIVKNEKGAPKASLFFVSYTKNGEAPGKRPISFCFNGGPGSSSVWLHVGLLGPKRVILSKKGEAPPPYGLEDNPFSLLDETDLVFIDPVSTGYSHAIPREDSKKFHSVEEDIKTIGEFVRLFLTRYNRWDSPKFIIGESYGTIRAASLASHLHDAEFIYVQGIVLISSILNYQYVDETAGNDLSYALALPTYAATAWYHQKLSPELQASLPQTLNQMKGFIENEYLIALFKGDLLAPAEKARLVNRLAYFTGLSPNYVEKSNLRIDGLQFAKELLRDQNRTLGRFDSRFLGIDANTLGERIEYDPSFDAICGAFTATFNHYLKNELKSSHEEPYKILTNVQPWNYNSSNKYLNVSEILRHLMTQNRHIAVFVASGLYDLAIPFATTEYTFNHLGLDPTLQSHVQMHTYPAGHMMYSDYLVLGQLKSDLASYYQEAVAVKTIEPLSP